MRGLTIAVDGSHSTGSIDAVSFTEIVTATLLVESQPGDSTVLARFGVLGSRDLSSLGGNEHSAAGGSEVEDG